MTGYQCIVVRDKPYLYHSLKRDLAEVEVLLDRRFEDRRQASLVYEPDRRRADRRRQLGVEDDLSSVGFAIIRQ